MNFVGVFVEKRAEFYDVRHRDVRHRVFNIIEFPRKKNLLPRIVVALSSEGKERKMVDYHFVASAAQEAAEKCGIIENCASFYNFFHARLGVNKVEASNFVASRSTKDTRLPAWIEISIRGEKYYLHHPQENEFKRLMILTIDNEEKGDRRTVVYTPYRKEEKKTIYQDYEILVKKFSSWAMTER